MKKVILTGISLVVLLTACGSGDNSKKNREDFQPNSKVQVISASQMETVQQEQDFPGSKPILTHQQYAQATATTAMQPVVMSDTSDESDSGTSLPAITQPNAPIQPISIPSAPTPKIAPTPALSAVQGSDIPSDQLPPVSASDFPPPVTTASPFQPQSQSVSAPAPQQSALITNSALSAQTKAIVQSNIPSSATTTNQPVTETYESLDSQPAQPAQPTGSSLSSAPYPSFDNVATPVTFTNSPYNTQMNSYGSSSPASTESAGPTDTAKHAPTAAAAAP